MQPLPLAGPPGAASPGKHAGASANASSSSLRRFLQRNSHKSNGEDFPSGPVVKNPPANTGDMDLSRECMFLDSLSRHNRDLERRTLKPPRRVMALRSWIDHVIALRCPMDRVIALRQISVTALFYLEDSRKIHLSGVRARRSKERRRAPQRTGERERELALAPLFICLSPPGPVLCKLGSQECCLFYLRSSLWSSDLLLFHFRRLFPSLSVATAILDSFSLFYLPNTTNQS